MYSRCCGLVCRVVAAVPVVFPGVPVSCVCPGGGCVWGFRWYGDGPGRVFNPVGAVVLRVGAAACYSPTSCRMQYHRRARSSLPGSEWVRASPLGHGRRKSVIIIPRDRACTCSLMGGCVVGWGPDGGRVCAEGSVV